jgi:hypothetical protein
MSTDGDGRPGDEDIDILSNAGRGGEDDKTTRLAAILLIPRVDMRLAHCAGTIVGDRIHKT